MAIQIAPKPQRPTARIIECSNKAVAFAEGDTSKAAVHPRRGRPASGKVRVTMLLDPDVVEKFRATGDGWQARINEALKKAQP